MGKHFRLISPMVAVGLAELGVSHSKPADPSPPEKALVGYEPPARRATPHAAE